VIAASAGNHAQGVALSAQSSGFLLIVMPRTTPVIKIEAVKSYGAEVILFGDNYFRSLRASQSIVQASGRVFIHPLMIRGHCGQGTIGREILNNSPT